MLSLMRSYSVDYNSFSKPHLAYNIVNLLFYTAAVGGFADIQVLLARGTDNNLLCCIRGA